MCMWCGAKFVSGPRCMRSQLYQLLVEDNEEMGTEPEEFSDCLETLEGMNTEEVEKDAPPVISLHALFGTGDLQTMRLQGHIKNHQVIILIDTRSTHTFIYHNVVKKIGWKTHPVSGKNITVVNGDTMWVHEGCRRVTWEA